MGSGHLPEHTTINSELAKNLFVKMWQESNAASSIKTQFHFADWKKSILYVCGADGLDPKIANITAYKEKKICSFSMFGMNKDQLSNLPFFTGFSEDSEHTEYEFHIFLKVVLSRGWDKLNEASKADLLANTKHHLSGKIIFHYSKEKKAYKKICRKILKDAAFREYIFNLMKTFDIPYHHWFPRYLVFKYRFLS